MNKELQQNRVEIETLTQEIFELYQVNLDFRVDDTNLQQRITLELCKAYDAGRAHWNPRESELKASRTAWRALAKSRLFTLSAIFDELKTTIENLKRPKSENAGDHIPIPIHHVMEIRELYSGGFRPQGTLDQSFNEQDAVQEANRSEFMNTCVLCNWTEESGVNPPIGHSANCEEYSG